MWIICNFNKQYQHWMVLIPKTEPMSRWMVHKTWKTDTGTVSHFKGISDKSLVLTITLVFAEGQH
jgi:hypothetical protein